MKSNHALRAILALTSLVGAGISLGGCDPQGPTATAIPASHEKSIDAIKNNPNMPDAAKQQAIARMQQADKEAGFMPTGSKK